MSKKLKPNFTPIPNVILDEIMRTLAPGTTKLLFAICRFTYGWGKQSDRISISQLEDITGMAHGSVARSIKQLGKLVSIKPGDPSRQLASEYRLNIEISDNDLVSLRDQPLVSERDKASLLASLIKRPSKDNQRKKKDCGAEAPSHLLFSLPKLAAQKGEGNSAAPGFKEAMGTYHDCFVSRFGAKPDIDGRDGKLLSGLLKAHGASEVVSLLRYFFESPPAWVEKGSKFTIPAFKSAYTEILAKSRNPKVQMGVL